MTDQDTLEAPSAPTLEEQIEALQKEVKAVSAQLDTARNNCSELASTLEELEIDTITTIECLKALGEEIVLSQGNHSDKKTLAEALCSQANKHLRKWRKKKSPPEYENYRRLLRNARLASGDFSFSDNNF
jgi:chromosome segregation ATPase